MLCGVFVCECECVSVCGFNCVIGDRKNDCSCSNVEGDLGVGFQFKLLLIYNLKNIFFLKRVKIHVVKKRRESISSCV